MEKGQLLSLETSIYTEAMPFSIPPKLAQPSWKFPSTTERSMATITELYHGPENDHRMPLSIPKTPAQPSWKFPSTTKRSTITELSCYHGALRGVEAEEKLKQQPGDSHLIRYSDSSEEYILSVLKRGANGPICQHFIIKTKLHDKSLYIVEGSDMTFHDVNEMLDYFRKNPISYEINAIGEPCFATKQRSLEQALSEHTSSRITRTRRKCCIL